MDDFGYDIADYCDVDPIFGSLADFDALVARAHALELKVTTDLVFAHTSDRHQWFAESRAGKHGDKADCMSGPMPNSMARRRPIGRRWSAVPPGRGKPGRAHFFCIIFWGDRERVGEGQRVFVRVDSGGGRSIKKKKNKN